MENQRQSLSSSEISNLWTHYSQETMSEQMNRYTLIHIQDEEIKTLFKKAIEFSIGHQEKIVSIFKEEAFPLPVGFTEKDVKLNAPSLLTEKFWLTHLHEMTLYGNTSYSLALNVSIREDVRKFYVQCLTDSIQLFNESMELLNKNNWLEKPPSYATSKQTEFIKGVGYAFKFLGRRRPLNTIETGSLFYNLRKTIVAKTILLSFSELCKNNDIKNFMKNSVELGNKHISIFSKFLLESNLHLPSTMDSEIIQTTISPFSERLMLSHIGFLLNTSISYYNTAMVSSMRADIITQSETAILRNAKSLAAWSHLMIKHQWMEKPPTADERQKKLS